MVVLVCVYVDMHCTDTLRLCFLSISVRFLMFFCGDTSPSINQRTQRTTLKTRTPEPLGALVYES